ncbi:MAG: T9SS type A sorting domain-containing protein, partial [Bacteroidales bacterium]|nr:T9SS type A sorting domain-containing protein [Bacteroidales bacterium]MCF8458249.1 T9SS type A sorting domain-containing protein [Bacteroidales bacterium]
SLNSKFIVTGNCTVGTNPGEQCPPGYLDYSTFEGFDIAIRVFGSSTTNTAHITQCSFDNNARAIQIDGIDNVVITRNYFEVGDCEITGLPSDDENFYGIKLIECEGFMVEENELDGMENYILPSIGIMPRHTNLGPELQDNNQIYNNDFTDLATGIHPVGVNTTSDYETGLQLLCNNFYNSYSFDIDVKEDPLISSSNTGIRELQGTGVGSNYISAGNRFTYNPPPSFVANYNNEGNAPIDYYYYDDPNDPTFNPAIVNGNWVQPFTGSNVLANNCPSHISTGVIFELEPAKSSDVYSKFLVGKTAYWNLYYTYLQLIDGGNTPLVLQQIQNTWPQEAWDLRNDLMAMAPYVSREALEEAALMDILPDAMLFEICLANPDATRDQEFLDFLANGIPNPLPNYMISLIQENWDLETPLSILKRNMAGAASKMDYNLSILLTNEKLKHEPDNNMLRNYHYQRDNLGDRYSIADSYIAEAKFDSSVIVLDQILLDFDLDDATIDEYDNYYLYHDLLQSLNDSNRSIFDLDTTEIALLDQIANDKTGKSGIKSRNILCFAFGLCEEYPGNPSDTSQNKSTHILMPPQQIIDQAYTTLNVTPNPATIFAEFSWEILNLENGALLEIVDMDGKVVAIYVINEPQGKWAWDTRNTIPGVYIYSLRGSGSILKSGKITVLKK